MNYSESIKSIAALFLLCNFQIIGCQKKANSVTRASYEQTLTSGMRSHIFTAGKHKMTIITSDAYMIAEHMQDISILTDSGQLVFANLEKPFDEIHCAISVSDNKLAIVKSDRVAEFVKNTENATWLLKVHK